MNRRLVIAIATTVGVLGGGYLGWLNWQAAQTSTPAEPHTQQATHQLTQFPPFFEEITIASGVDFQHWCGDGGKYFFPEVMGSGVALFDYNRDDRLDIFVVQGVPAKAGDRSRSSRLFRQQEDGRFLDVTDESGLADGRPYGLGACVGDVNNDGWPDLYVTKYGPDRLWLNKEGKFEDITQSAGVSNPRWGTSAGFVDFDRDGWLDLFVTNYVDYYPSRHCIAASGQQDYCHPGVFGDAPSRLFRNLTGESSAPAPGVRFQDVSLESGIDARPGPGLGVLIEDFSGDGWPDLYVANDAKANFLWINQKNGTFADEAIAAGAAYDRAGRPQSSMGIASGDVDSNGLADLFVTHLDGEYSTLYLHLTQGIFEDRTIDAGLAGTIPFTGFGTALGDLDLDGDLDLVITNGRVRRKLAVQQAVAEPPEFWQAYAERNQLFVGCSGGTFTEADPAIEPFSSGEHVGRGLATGDLDNDGSLDLVTSEVNGPARIYRNVAPGQGHWLLVRVLEPKLGGRDAYGARVTVRSGDRVQTRTVNPAFSYLSSSDPRVHFGLGDASQYEELLVHFADGDVESYPSGEANRQVTLKRGMGAAP